jgi:peptide/nickel transport system substrate-binding protein
LQLAHFKVNSQKISFILYFVVLLILVACQSAALTPSPASTNLSPTTVRLDTATPTIILTPQPSNDPTVQPTLSTSPIEASASQPLAALPPTSGGVATVGLIGQPTSLNPVTENDSAVRELAPLLFETLFRTDPQTARLQPGLAQYWEYSEDGQQVFVHLFPNLKWSDGSPYTAANIAQSLMATQHPALLAFSDLAALDDDTLVLTFSTIDCAAVTTVGLLPLLPASQITSTAPNGSGPFVVEDWTANERTLTLTQNPNYHGPPPLLDGLSIRFIRESEVAIASSEGQFDLLGPLQSPASTVQPPRFTDIAYLAPQVIYLAINFDPRNDAPLAPQVRQALVLALDRQALLNEALAGDGQLVVSSLLPTHWAANPNLTLPDYNPEAAQRLLAEAGLKDSDGDGWLDQNGRRLQLSIRVNGQNELHQNLGWLMSSYYRELGLFARSESVPFDSVVDDLFTHDFSLALFSWFILPDPDQRLYWRSTENSEGFGLNFVAYKNPRLDNLLDQAVSIPGCQTQARAELYADIQETLATEHPVDFLLVPNRHVFVNDRLQGLIPGPFAALTWNVTEWYLQNE